VNVNHSTAIFLFNDKVRAVLAIYEAPPAAGMPEPKKTMYKTLDPSVKVGDLVLVPSGTRHNVTVVKVTNIGVDVDPESPTQVDWIIAVVDRSAYEKVKGDEAQAIDAIKSAQKTKKRNEIAAAVLADAKEGLAGLAIVDSKTIAALPGPAAK
jgi:hypothetical protein